MRIDAHAKLYIINLTNNNRGFDTNKSIKLEAMKP